MSNPQIILNFFGFIASFFTKQHKHKLAENIITDIRPPKNNIPANNIGRIAPEKISPLKLKLLF